MRHAFTGRVTPVHRTSHWCCQHRQCCEHNRLTADAAQYTTAAIHASLAMAGVLYHLALVLLEWNGGFGRRYYVLLNLANSICLLLETILRKPSNKKTNRGLGTSEIFCRQEAQKRLLCVYRGTYLDRYIKTLGARSVYLVGNRRTTIQHQYCTGTCGLETKTALSNIGK